MELTETFLTAMAEANPGDFAFYLFAENRLILLQHSPCLAAAAGRTEEEYAALTAGDALNAVPDSERLRLLALLRGLRQTGQDADFSHRILHKTLGQIPVQAKIRRIGTLRGAPVLAASFVWPGPEAQEYARLLDCISSTVYVIDRASYELLYVNTPTLRQLNRTAYLGQNCYRFACGFDAPCPWCSLPSMKDGCFHGEACYAAGLNRWYTVDCVALNWHGRDAVAVYAADRTGQMRQQKELELDRSSLDSTIRNLPVGIGVCVIQGGTVRSASVNPCLTRLLGVTADTFAGSDPQILERLHPEDRAATECAVARVRDTGDCISFEFRFRQTNTSEYAWYHAQTNSLSSPDSRTVFVCVVDITAEKRAEADRANARRMYEAAVEDAGLVVWQYDLLHRRVTMAENEFTEYDYRKFDLPKTIENVPESLTPLIADEDVPAFLAMYRAVAEGKPRASCEVWYKLKPDQEPRCEHISYTTVYNGDGNPIGAYGIGQNRTTRKLEEQRYRQVNRQFADSLVDAVISAHLDLTNNRCLNVQSSLPGLAAFHRDDTADAFWAAALRNVPDSDVRRQLQSRLSRENLLALYKTGDKHSAADYPVLHADDLRHWLHGSLTMMQNPVTGAVEAICYASDITAQMKNKAIIEHLTGEKFDYIGILDFRHKSMEFQNRQTSVIFSDMGTRLPYDDWRRHFVEHFVPEADRSAYLQGTEMAVIRAGLDAPGGYTFSFTQIDGGSASRRQLQFSWLDRGEDLALAVRTDITEAYRREQEQLNRTQQALRDAEAANRAKTEFVSRISHDIRTPISIIKSMTAFAMEDRGDPERWQDDLRKIEASSTFLLSLINDVLDISKIDSGKVALTPEPYPYDDYISNIRNMFEPLCRQKNLTFVVQRAPTASIVVVDHTRLNQITLNLLSNAVKYTPAGGTVTFTAHSTPQQDGRLLCSIQVRDTGIGMSKAFQAKMFEPFSQEYDNPLRSKANSGTGLGLSIVKRLVDLIGGRIVVKSVPGKGTTIRVTFLAEASNVSTAPTPAVFSAAPVGVLSGKVLLAEDNEINTAIACRLLERFGLTVDTAENGKQAVRRFSESRPGEYRAVLMDIQMPLLNGYEATEAIRALDRPDAAAVPIIAMTADAFSAAMERSCAAGMNEYVTKPLDPEVLRAVLAKVFQAQTPGTAAQ